MSTRFAQSGQQVFAHFRPRTGGHGSTSMSGKPVGDDFTMPIWHRHSGGCDGGALSSAFDDLLTAAALASATTLEMILRATDRIAKS